MAKWLRGILIAAVLGTIYAGLVYGMVTITPMDIPLLGWFIYSGILGYMGAKGYDEHAHLGRVNAWFGITIFPIGLPLVLFFASRFVMQRYEAD